MIQCRPARQGEHIWKKQIQTSECDCPGPTEHKKKPERHRLSDRSAIVADYRRFSEKCQAGPITGELPEIDGELTIFHKFHPRKICGLRPGNFRAKLRLDATQGLRTCLSRWSASCACMHFQGLPPLRSRWSASCACMQIQGLPPLRSRWSASCACMQIQGLPPLRSRWSLPPAKQTALERSLSRDASPLAQAARFRHSFSRPRPKGRRAAPLWNPRPFLPAYGLHALMRAADIHVRQAALACRFKGCRPCAPAGRYLEKRGGSLEDRVVPAGVREIGK